MQCHCYHNLRLPRLDIDALLCSTAPMHRSCAFRGGSGRFLVACPRKVVPSSLLITLPHRHSSLTFYQSHPQCLPPRHILGVDLQMGTSGSLYLLIHFFIPQPGGNAAKPSMIQPQTVSAGSASGRFWSINHGTWDTYQSTNCSR